MEEWTPEKKTIQVCLMFFERVMKSEENTVPSFFKIKLDIFKFLSLRFP